MRMVDEWNVEGAECVQIHPHLKAKIAAQTKKLRGKTKGREETEAAREFPATTG